MIHAARITNEALYEFLVDCVRDTGLAARIRAQPRWSQWNVYL